MTESQPPSGTITALMAALSRELVEELDGVGCIVSCVIGDVIAHLTDYSPDARNLQLGRGFLVSDFPETRAVLESGAPSAVSVLDAAPDPAEVSVLEDLGVSSVLMLALRPGGRPWGLVEVYRTGRSFDAADAKRARTVVERATASLHDALEF